MAPSSMSRPRQCSSRCRAHGEQTHSWSRSGTWSWPCDSSCTWSRSGGSSWPCGLCTRWRASSCPSRVTSLFPAVCADDSGCASLSVHRQSWTLQFDIVTGFLLVQTVQKTVEIPLCSSLARLLSSRCCATTGAGFRQCCPVEMPLLQFIDSRRHPCCSGPDSACRGAAVAVYRQSSTFQLWRRGKFGVQTARKLSTFHGCSFQCFQG